MSVSVEFKGGVELQAALARLADDRQIMVAARQALRSAARPIQATAIDLAPEYQGFLKQAIKVGPGKGEDRDHLFVVVGIDQNVDPPRYVARANGKGVYRDPGVAGHSVIVEFGRADVPAEPFMTPAWDQHAMLTPDRIGEALWPAIDRAAARIARKAAKAS